jgi:hypothetical protein
LETANRENRNVSRHHLDSVSLKNEIFWDKSHAESEIKPFEKVDICIVSIYFRTTAAFRKESEHRKKQQQNIASGLIVSE